MRAFLIHAIKALLWLIDADHRQRYIIVYGDLQKFTDAVDVDFQSDYGRATKVYRTVPYEVWELHTDTKRLLAADHHRIIRADYTPTWVSDLLPGDAILTDSGVEVVVSCRATDVRTHMYSLEVHTADPDDPMNHLYYTNGILSHNTTAAAAYLLWKAMFTPDFTVLITANNYLQALEIMQRVSYAYEGLPDHIRAGVKEYNKGNISFDNGSRIISRATTPRAGRGLSISLLYVDEFAAILPNIAKQFWTAIRPVLSCVVGETMVLTEKGFRQIDDFHIDRDIGEYFEVKDLQVWGKHGLEDVSHGYVSPESETLIIETTRGYRLEVTPNHPLYRLNDKLLGEMTPAKLLAIGDKLRISVNMNVYGNDDSLSIGEMTPDFAYMIGGWIAEGWISKGYDVSISNVDPEFRQPYLENTIIRRFKVNGYGKLRCNSKAMVELFKEIGIDPAWKCHTKRIPRKIWHCSQAIQAQFLRGLFDGDGHVSTACINLSSVSRELLADVQLMLGNMGIVSTIRLAITGEAQMAKQTVMPHGNIIKSAKDSYGLTICRAQFAKFDQLIGLSIARKSARLQEVASSTIQNDDKVMVIPKTAETIDFITTLLHKSEKTVAWYRDNGCRLDKVLQPSSTKGVVTHSFLKSFLSHVTLTESEREVVDELVGDFLWDSIKTITPSSNRTYDFTVPTTHSFLQNGILGSNTGGSCIITSTPLSDVDQFAEIWYGAIDNKDGNGNLLNNGLGRNEFFATKFTWEDHPDRDDKWANTERASLGEVKFLQEHCCQFVTDIDTLINPLLLTRMRPKPPDYYIGPTRWYHEPEPNHAYIVALDPSLGMNQDYGAIEVFQLPEMKQIAEWQSNVLAPRLQAAALREILISLDYALRENPNQEGDPDIFWTFENNSIGEAILQIVEDSGEDRFPGALVTERKRKGMAQPRVRKGMNTTPKRKLSACARLKSLVETNRIEINSQNLITEMKNFVAIGSSYRAKSGEHDDLISATMLAIRAIDVLFYWGVQSGELREFIADDEVSYIEAMPVVI